MDDFITFDLTFDLSPPQVLELCKQAFPAFNWRWGDSDQTGPYVSGMNSDRVHIQMELGETPIPLWVSFRCFWPEAADREARKQQIIDVVRQDLIPSLVR